MRFPDLRRLRSTALVEGMRASLWFVPTVMVIGSGLAAAGLSRVQVEQGSVLGHLVFPGGADSARGILQAIAGSVITVTGVVFSLTVVTLQLASSQFSPRLLRTFLRDVSNQIVLGTFLATFSYALLVLRGVQSGQSPDDDVVPAAAVTFAYVLTAASVVALVYFIDHIARSIRIDSLLRDVNEDTAQVIDDLYGGGRGTGGSGVPVVPESAVTIAAPRSGFVQGIDSDLLLRHAKASTVTILIATFIGDRVIEGNPLARVWATGTDVDQQAIEASVHRAVRIGYERTAQQDIAFGFRQLVDVAVKALSPGVNDPTTAVHAISHIAALLTLLVRRDVGTRVHTDANSGATVIVPGMELPQYLDLACGQIRRYGAAEPSVVIELLRMLRDLAACQLDDSSIAAVEREADMLVAAAGREVSELQDLEPVHALSDDIRASLVVGR